MLQIGDWNVSGEIVLAIMIAISWIACGIVAIATKDSEAFGAAFLFSLLCGFGYLILKGK